MAESIAPKVEAPRLDGAHDITNSPGQSARQPRRPSQHHLYRQPVPLRTFPLPTFYPANPLSLLHIAYVWVRQVISPPVEPAVVYTGVWSEETRSVHVLVKRDIEALWFNGSFGKGIYSRSEPTWKTRMLSKRSQADDVAAEQVREARRDVRKDFKWERARLEQMAIETARLAEVSAPGDESVATASQEHQSLQLPVNGNSVAGGSPHESHSPKSAGLVNGSAALSVQPKTQLLSPPASPVTPMALLRLPNSVFDRDEANNIYGGFANGSPKGKQSATSILPVPLADITNALGKPSQYEHPLTPTPEAEVVNGAAGSRGLKRQKSVRFSPDVESTTFRRTDPPSPNYSPPTQPKYPSSAGASGVSLTNGEDPGVLSPMEALSPSPSLTSANVAVVIESPAAEGADDVPEREHLQLSMEEAFFLSFGVGALAVTNPADGTRFSNEQLFALFRQYSHMPPRMSPSSVGVAPDDPFLTRYAVYHRYRTLGWVVRDGIKFGVDLLLYLKGPVFSHAEFALIIMPPNGGKSWHWLHAVNRTLSMVYKSLLLIYVDPPSDKLLEIDEDGVAGVLQRYRIREVLIKRWSSNRNR